MDIARVRAFYYERPVRPFTIHVASGERYTVHHPERIAINEDDQIVVVVGNEGFHILDISSITDLSWDDNQAASVES